MGRHSFRYESIKTTSQIAFDKIFFVSPNNICLTLQFVLRMQISYSRVTHAVNYTIFNMMEMYTTITVDPTLKTICFIRWPVL